MKKMNRTGWIVELLVLALLFTGCGPSAAAPAPSATPAPTKAPATPTSTVTPTPLPSHTPTQTRTPTPDLKATVFAKNAASQTAIAKQDQARLEQIDADLKTMGIDPGKGSLVWTLRTPVELDGTGYATGYFKPITGVDVVKDFVIQTDVTWNTSGALSGCGLLFRAPDDFDVKIGDFYIFDMLRVQYAPAWVIGYYKDGRYEYSLPGLSGVTSDNIEDENDTQNTVTLDVRGDTFTVYINGVKERSIQNNKIAEGRVAFEVTQESGTSYCKFENAWLWEYAEEE